MTFSKLDSIRYASHIEDCLQVVVAAAEYDTDIFLVQKVKLQKIVEEVRFSGLHNDSSLKGPVGMYVSSFQAALQEYKSALPANLQQNSQYHQPCRSCITKLALWCPQASILLNYFSAKIQLYQICFQIPPPADDNSRFQRMEVLSACLSAARSFFEVWFSLPSALYFSLSFKLCLFNAEDWDLSQVLRTIHMSSITEEMANRMEEASTTFGREGDLSSFAVSARNLRLAKIWYEAKLAASTVVVDPYKQVNGVNADSIVIGNKFDVWNEDLWRGFITNWDMVR
jgi:hypothetical protein